MISSNFYNIISSGSKGNAVIIGDQVLIDCGVAYKAISPYVKGLRLVVLTHCHSDHFRKSTVKKLAEMRPTLRFGCCEWLVKDLIDCGVSKFQIDVYALDKVNQYATSCLTVEAFGLYHNVPNCGYKIVISGKRILYATDTCKIDTDAPGYDMYLIEANYDEDELQERIARKEAEGAEYINELVVPDNHLSRTAATEFVLKNAGPHSDHVFMHVHEEKDNGQRG